MRPALPSVDVWNTLGSCASGDPATELQSGAGSVPQGDDMFDEGLWGEDWAAAGSTGAGSPELCSVQPQTAAASETFAGHDRVAVLRLLAKVIFSKQRGLLSWFSIVSARYVGTDLSHCCIEVVQSIPDCFEHPECFQAIFW